MSDAKGLQEIAALYSKNALDQAREKCRAVLQSHPDSPDALRMLAVIESRLENRDAGLAAIIQALAIRPSDPVSLNVKGVLLIALDRVSDALEAFELALRIQPTFTPAVLNRGNALLQLGRPNEALDCFDKAVALAPGDPSAALQRGKALLALARHGEALQSITRATQLNPRHGEAYLALADVLRMSGRSAEALAAFDAVLSFDPQNKLALQNSATLLHMVGELDRAIVRYEQLIKLLRPNPAFVEQLDYALGMTISCRRTMCAWEGLRELEAEVIDHVRQGSAAIKPHLSLMITDDPEIQSLCARRTWAKQFGGRATRPVFSGRRKRDRLRIGYMSGDFRDHPTSWLVAGLIESHDRSAFEIFAYSSAPDDGSTLRRRMVAAFDHFADISTSSDDEAASHIAADDIDILVDLNGLTDWGRGGVVARRPAPITAHFLVYPGPLGTHAFDYIIADAVVIPPDQSRYFDSAIVRLPGCYQVNDRARELPARAPSRQAVGLPSHGFVFCGFCQPTKLSPDVFDVWMRILARSPASVLWLLEDNRFMQASLSREARIRGVDPARLVFAQRTDQRAHMERHQLADLVLDTWPCGAHTSAGDALWLGVPVLTRPGRSFASRVAASALLAMNLGELIAGDVQSYENIAVDLSQNISNLAETKSRISAARTVCSLFDTDRFRRNLESAFRAMWSRFENDYPIKDLVVTESER